jgi:hypothetical protein
MVMEMTAMKMDNEIQRINGMSMQVLRLFGTGLTVYISIMESPSFRFLLH